MGVRCILGFVLSFRTTFVGVLLAPTVFRVVSALSRVDAFNRILVLVLVLALLLPLLSLLSLLAFAFALAVLAFAVVALAFAKRTDVNGSSPPGCDGPSCFVVRTFAWPLHSQYVLISFIKTP